MFNGISWLNYIKTILSCVVIYYVVIGWIYRKDLLQWWRRDKK